MTWVIGLQPFGVVFFSLDKDGCEQRDMVYKVWRRGLY